MVHLVKLSPLILILWCGYALAVSCPAGQWVNGVNPQACSTPVASGSGTYPAGGPPQLTGYSAANSPEAETISNDCTFTRTGANAYKITCTTAGGGTGNFEVGSLGVGIAADGTSGDALFNDGIEVGPNSSLAGTPGSGVIGIDAHLLCNTNAIPCIEGTDASALVFTMMLADSSNRIAVGDATHNIVLNGLTNNSNALQTGGVNKFAWGTGGVQIVSDNLVNTMARLPLTFHTSSTTTATNFGVFKTVKAITIENNEVVDELATGCAAGSVVRVYDCGTSAPANAACSGGTQKTTATTSTTAGTTVDGTVSSAAVAAGHYLGAQIQALGGSCTAVMIELTLMTRPQ